MSSSPPGQSAPFPQPPPLQQPPLGDPGCLPPSHLHCLAQSVTHPGLAWGLMVSRGPRAAMHTIRKPQSSLGLCAKCSYHHVRNPEKRSYRRWPGQGRREEGADRSGILSENVDEACRSALLGSDLPVPLQSKLEGLPTGANRGLSSLVQTWTGGSRGPSISDVRIALVHLL